ncbi:MAG: hypothetical protein M1434_04960 [Chloroflexi bacterium]|nr:hypothetical protein [Chloroflexota bacterium]MCL5274083.1 hypothetical protein [Chloroflexota bacterium]
MKMDRDEKGQDAISRQPKFGRRNMLIGMAGIVGMGLFGGVACAIGQQAPANQSADAGGGQGSSNGGPGRGQYRVTPAPELPASQPDLTGILVRRQGSNVFVGTGGFGRAQGNNGARPTRDPNATRQPVDPNATRAPYNGPETEVVTDSNTKLYKDVTQFNFQQGGQNTAAVQEQVQSVDTLDNLLGSDTTFGTVTVWGTKKGDQLVAIVLVYRPRQAPPGAQSNGG